jgi:HSP20 family molecular chaperone IbpA
MTDIKTSDEGIEIRVNAVGIDPEKIDIKILPGEGIKASYKKPKADEEAKYLHRGIPRTGFDYGWKFNDEKYDLTKATAKIERGELVINVPYTDSKKPKPLQITV